MAYFKLKVTALRNPVPPSKYISADFSFWNRKTKKAKPNDPSLFDNWIWIYSENSQRNILKVFLDSPSPLEREILLEIVGFTVYLTPIWIWIISSWHAQSEIEPSLHITVSPVQLSTPARQHSESLFCIVCMTGSSTPLVSVKGVAHPLITNIANKIISFFILSGFKRTFTCAFRALFIPSFLYDHKLSNLGWFTKTLHFCPNQKWKNFTQKSRITSLKEMKMLTYFLWKRRHIAKI